MGNTKVSRLGRIVLPTLYLMLESVSSKTGLGGIHTTTVQEAYRKEEPNNQEWDWPRFVEALVRESKVG